MSFLQIIKPIFSQLPDWANTGVGGSTDMGSLIKTVLNIIILVVLVAAVVFLMLNGLKYITSQGDQSKVQEATKGIMYAIIGIVVALAASILVNFVLSQLDVKVPEISMLLVPVLG